MARSREFQKSFFSIFLTIARRNAGHFGNITCLQQISKKTIAKKISTIISDVMIFIKTLVPRNLLDRLSEAGYSSFFDSSSIL